MAASKKVILLRGISGAGKSTYTSKHFPGAVVCSADQYFISPDGNYKFDPEKLGSAHGSCKRKFKKALEANDPLIVVDNTNTTLWEMQPYIQLAAAHGYDVDVIRLEVSPELAASRNLHGVPPEAIKKMQDRMVDYPGEKIVSGVE
jgi:predicted kinase